MGNLISNTKFALQVSKGILSRLLFGWDPINYQGDLEKDSFFLSSSPSFLKDVPLVAKLKENVFKKDIVDHLSDEQLVKICRQLEFWYSESGGNLKNESNVEFVNLASTLIDQSLWHKTDPSINKVPKVRFGKTELQMPIVTCGGMRLQSTWLPDFVPLLRPSRKTVLSGATQNNIKNCIRSCLALGINHFETARFYGTSEYQFVEALYELIQEGEIKREDFILQTKNIVGNTKSFKKYFNQSWENIGEKLGYIDLHSLHAIHEVNDDLYESLAVCEELKKEGKIRHIGFSTHGTSKQIMDLINTEKFEYINLHYHYFGSYHGSGTDDTKGGEGNLSCVERALELDMGVFQISPFDKGGKLYRPSKECAIAVGKELSPMEFAALYAWRKVGIHTSSVGIARVSDLDEVMSAARTMALGQKGGIDLDTLLNGCLSRLDEKFTSTVGKEWAEKGLLNIPSCFDESTQGIAIGHILWLHDMLTGYGMYEFCKDRYSSLEGTKWNNAKSFKENISKMSGANAGRSFDDQVDLSNALKNHYDPEQVIMKLKETHKWLSTKEIPSSGYTSDDLAQMGFQKSYNLTVWTELPGEADSTALKKVLLQTLTGGRMGFITGPGYSFRQEAKTLRSNLM